jgi:hypothetical protein
MPLHCDKTFWFMAAPIAPSSRRLSIKGRCCERDSGYKTHLVKRLGLLQAHYKNDDKLEGIPK